MDYLAHIADGRCQSVKEHLLRTGDLAAYFGQEFGAGEMCRILGKTHDLGKYSQAFQRYIRLPSEQQHRGMAPHADTGMQILWHTAGEVAQRLAAAFAVAGHHSGLPNLGNKSDMVGGSLLARLRREIPPDVFTSVKAEGMMPTALPKGPMSLAAAWSKDKEVSEASFAYMVYVRMLFSSLVDADFLDTEQFMRAGTIKRVSFVSLRTLKQRLDAYVQRFAHPTTPLAERRTAILRSCIAAGDAARYQMYQLTVPTGGGKTIASLAFALHYAAAKKFQHKRVIYVIPYTAIIEQTAAVFRGIVGAENVVEHHHQVSWDDTESQPDKKRLAAENWDAPLIVTTNVQFFESLFANKPSRCRKLHNIAGSIVIFDEAQMIPVSFLRPCMRMVQELAMHYGCAEIFCTATQPSLQQFFPTSYQQKEICPQQQENYQFFQRCRYEIIDEPLSREKLAAYLQEQGQVLCIVNRKQMASELYDLLPPEGRFYLTTNLYPVHRQRVLYEIRQCLATGKTCRLVATSLVEAGVDIDFPAVWREMAGLDNIIQSAGRCNRENRHNRAESITHVFTLQDIRYPQYIRQKVEITQRVLQRYGEKLAAPEAIAYYFQELHQLSETDALHLLAPLPGTQAGTAAPPLLATHRFPFAEVAARFHLLQDDTIPVLVPFATQSDEEEHLQELAQQLRLGIITRKGMRKAALHAVAVYPQVLQELIDTGRAEQIDKMHYAVLMDADAYDDDKGLITNFTDGSGIFF